MMVREGSGFGIGSAHQAHLPARHPARSPLPRLPLVPVPQFTQSALTNSINAHGQEAKNENEERREEQRTKKAMTVNKEVWIGVRRSARLFFLLHCLQHQQQCSL